MSTDIAETYDHLYDQWLTNMDNGNLVFLDTGKAFDTADHTFLLQKLNCYGIKGDSVKLLESYLTDRMWWSYIIS